MGDKFKQREFNQKKIELMLTQGQILIAMLKSPRSFDCYLLHPYP